MKKALAVVRRSQTDLSFYKKLYILYRCIAVDLALTFSHLRVASCAFDSFLSSMA